MDRAIVTVIPYTTEIRAGSGHIYTPESLGDPQARRAQA